ncbi:MAG: alpha-ketoacid dehydrogenase subunit beta [Actinobacteria bacterium]|nr:alpha-ketoacid dehydrogenase subunit beta [Actinomycetota bacterium]
MRTITFREALTEALREEMDRDKDVLVFGEDVGVEGGAFKVTDNFLQIYGEERCKDTPISEVAIAGAAIGASMCGLRPVAEFQFNDFLGVAGDQIINQMAKMRYMSGGQLKLPLVVRCPMGGGLSAAAQHSQCLEGLFMAVPGLIIVCPSTPYDAKGLLKSAIREENPVLFFEHVTLYDSEGEIPEDEYLVPLGKSEIKRKGEDVTVVAVSEVVGKALKASEILEKQYEINIEIIDPRTLCPLDMEPIIESVRKTSRLVVAHPEGKTHGCGSEIVSRVVEQAMEYLDENPIRVAAENVPIPFAPNMEKFVLVQVEDIVEACKKLRK